MSAAAAVGGRRGFILRSLVSAAWIGGYYWVRNPLGELMKTWYASATGGALDASTPPVFLVTLMLAGLVAIWWRLLKADPRFHGPLLVTTILALGDAAFNFLENQTAPPWLMELTGGRITEYSPTFVVIVATMLAELALGRFFWGKWPHLASAYISGISTGILIKSPELWPFVLCGLISISSKYVLRIGNRHLWNPTNFGVSMVLFLAPASVAALSVQAGNNGWALAVIWLLGGMILYRFGLWHIPITFVAAFIPLAFVRSWATGHPWRTELAPITSPMFQLYIFFMITDPKTIVRGKGKQVMVVLIIAVMETILRLAIKDFYSLFHALFIVGPVANLVEIYSDHRKKKAAAPVVTKSRTTEKRGEPELAPKLVAPG
jgi:hypothetical protein